MIVLECNADECLIKNLGFSKKQISHQRCKGEVVKIEEQVCSLELAKKLKKLGVEQDSLWWWVVECSEEAAQLYFKWDVPKTEPKEKIYSAFTVAELGKMLPRSFKMVCWVSGVHQGSENLYIINYGSFLSQHADTEANARAKMLIHLKVENNA